MPNQSSMPEYHPESDDDFDSMGKISETCAKAMIQYYEDKDKFFHLILQLVDVMYWHGIHSNVIDAYLVTIGLYRCCKCHDTYRAKPSRAYHPKEDFEKVEVGNRNVCKHCGNKLYDYYKEEYDVE